MCEHVPAASPRQPGGPSGACHDHHLRHHAARRHPARGPVALGRGQAAHRARASTTSACTTSRAASPARTPRTSSSSSASRDLKLDDRRRLRVRLDAPQGRRRRGRRRARGAARHRLHGAVHRRQGVGPARRPRRCSTTLDENVAHGRATRVAYLKAAGPHRLLRRRALLRRLRRATRSTPLEVCRGRRGGRRRRRRAVRHQRRHAAARASRAIVRRGRRRACPTRRSASTRTTTPACAVANSLVAVDAGCTHVQGTMNGYGERAGNADLTAIIPALVLKMGDDCVTRDQLRAAHRGQPLRRRDREPLARPAPALRGHERVRAQGRAARVGAPTGSPARTSTSTRRRWATSRASS